jgi:hypothetical protein
MGRFQSWPITTLGRQFSRNVRVKAPGMIRSSTRSTVHRGDQGHRAAVGVHLHRAGVVAAGPVTATARPPTGLEYTTAGTLAPGAGITGAAHTRARPRSRRWYPLSCPDTSPNAVR